MTVDSTPPPERSAPASAWAFVWSLALGLGIPFAALVFGGIGGGAGYLTAIAAMAIAAVATRRTAERLAGVALGLLATSPMIFGLLALASGDI